MRIPKLLKYYPLLFLSMIVPLLLLLLRGLSHALNAYTMCIDQISTKIRSIHLDSHKDRTHYNLVTRWSKVRDIALLQPVEHCACHDKVIETGMHKSNLNFRDQSLLALFACLIQSIALDHRIQLRASC